MKVHQLMQKHLVSVSNTATIHNAALKMKEEGVGSVLIVDEKETLLGIVTDRDIAIAVAAENRDPQRVCAYEIMTDDPITVASDTDIEYALRVMNTGNIRRLPVCEKGKLVGMLSSADLANELKEEFDNFIGLEGGFAKH